MNRYRIYIDESGNPDSRVGADSPHRYLSLTGVMIDEDYARTVVVPTFNKLKSEHFGHWPYPVIFHRKDIVIEDHVFIGSHCAILGGAIIGHHSVIGAGTVVRGTIPPYSLVLGNPMIVKAGYYRERFASLPPD